MRISSILLQLYGGKYLHVKCVHEGFSMREPFGPFIVMIALQEGR
jgi:hypothetical protein